MKTKVVGLLAIIAMITCVVLYLSKNPSEKNTGFDVVESTEEPAVSPKEPQADWPDPFPSDEASVQAPSPKVEAKDVASSPAPESESSASISPKMRAKARDVLQTTGIERRLNSYGENVRNQFDLAVKSGDLKPEEAEEVIRIFQEAVDPEKILKDFEEELAREFTAEDLKYIDEKLAQNDNYQKLMDFEESLSDPAAMEKFQSDFMEYMNKNQGKIPEARQHLIEEYDKHTGSSKMLVEMTMEMLESAGVSDPELRENTESLVREQILQSLSYVTKDTSNADLKDLIGTVSDERVKKFNGINQKKIKGPVAAALAKVARHVQEKAEKDLGDGKS